MLDNINYNKSQFSSGDELSGDELSGDEYSGYDNSGSNSGSGIITNTEKDPRSYVSLFIILGIVIIIGVSMLMVSRLSINTGTEIHRSRDILDNSPEISTTNENNNLKTLDSFNTTMCSEV